MNDLTNWPLISKYLNGKNPEILFARYQYYPNNDDPIKELDSYLRAGNTVYAEFTDGAKKGAIGKLEFNTDFINTYYENKYGRRPKWNNEIKITWEDRKNTDKWKTNNTPRFKLNFIETNTKWEFKTKEEPDTPADLYDHFGVKLEPGLVCLYRHGSTNRFGKISRITPKGSVFVIPIKTLPHQSKSEVMVGNTTDSASFVVIDDDLKTKLLVAALKG